MAIQNTSNSTVKNARSGSHYDAVIVGAGLTGLSIASALSQQMEKVALVDSKDFVGGALRSQTPFEVSLNYTPDNEKSRELLNFLGLLLGEVEFFEEQELSPVCFENSQMIPFVGFGEKGFLTASELSYYSSSRQLRTKMSPEQCCERLAELFTGQWMAKSEVTSIEVTDSVVSSITLNGAQKITADRFLFTLSPKIMAKLLPPEVWPARVLQKIHKAKLWTSVGLYFQHQSLPECPESLHFLMGNKNDFEPCVGRFYPGESPTSSWLSLVDSDLTEDAEHLSGILRNMKKLIKRAYPTALDQVTEKIIIQPLSHGQVSLGSEINPLLENLWLLSGAFSTEQGWLGSLAQAKEILQQLLTPTAAGPTEELVAPPNPSC